MASNKSDSNNKTQDLAQEIVECRRHGYNLSGKFLGQGAYAKVYLGHATQETISNNPRLKAESFDGTSCKVAIKIISSESAPKVYISKFLPREISTMNKCYNHKNVVRLYDMFATMKRVYLIMEYASTGDLLTYINQCCVKNSCNSVTEPIAKVIFRDIILGLRFIHYNNVAHRDLKCENILLSNGLNVKLTDFGFAVDNDGNKEHLKTHCGSYAYAPPEILRQQKYDGKLADLWSLGVILFAMVNGGLPFKESSAKAVLAAMKKPVYFKSHLSADCKNIIRGLLKIKPQRRLTISEILCHPWISSVTDNSMIQNFDSGTLFNVHIKGKQPSGDHQPGESKIQHSPAIFNRISKPEKVLMYLQTKMSPTTGIKSSTRYLNFSKPKINEKKKQNSNVKITPKAVLHGKPTYKQSKSKPDHNQQGKIEVNNTLQGEACGDKITNRNEPSFSKKTSNTEETRKQESKPNEKTRAEEKPHKKPSSPNVINLKIDRKSGIKSALHKDFHKYQTNNAFPINMYSLPYQTDKNVTMTKLPISPEKTITTNNTADNKQTGEIKSAKDGHTCAVQHIDLIPSPDTAKFIETKVKAKSVSPSHQPHSGNSRSFRKFYPNKVLDTTPPPVKKDEDERVCRSAFNSLDTVQYHLTCTHAKRRNVILKSRCKERQPNDGNVEVRKPKPKSQCSMSLKEQHKTYHSANLENISSNNQNSHQAGDKPIVYYNADLKTKGLSPGTTSYKYNYSFKNNNEETPKLQHVLDFRLQKQMMNKNYMDPKNNCYTEIIPLPARTNGQRIPDTQAEVAVYKKANLSSAKDMYNKLVLPKCRQAFAPLPSCGIVTWKTANPKVETSQNILNNVCKKTQKQKNIVLKLQNR